MAHKYQALLSPLKVGNVIFKNRMTCPTSLPHILQGPEDYPAEAVIDHFMRQAKNGAALVAFPTEFGYPDPNQPPEFAAFNTYLNDSRPQNWRYFAQLADAVHFYGTKISVVIAPMLPDGYGVGYRPPLMLGGQKDEFAGFDGAPPFSGFGELKEAATEMFDEPVERYAQLVRRYQSFGFDMCTIHASYRGSTCAQLMSPLTNHRIDQYGGSLENRARFTVNVCRRIKELCGKDFPIELQISGEEREGGITLEETIQFAKIFESYADILQLRGADGEVSHPTGFNSRPGWQKTLEYAHALKDSGTSLIIVPVGGYQDLDENERYISEGTCDMIGMARAFICDPEYGKKAYEECGEDVVPCLRCNRCHSAQGNNEELVSMCSVNPEIGWHVRLNRMIIPAQGQKKVAVVGGGPGGMYASIQLRQRGYEVDLFEAEDALGGQLRHADFVSFKWPLSRYKDYLIRQVEKNGVKVHLNTKATVALLAEGGYDAVIAALGAEPKMPNVKGNEKAWYPTAVYGREDELGERVVIVGGAATGTETGMHLAQKGKKVTVLTRQDLLAHDSMYVHYYDTMETAWKALNNFSYILNATATEVTDSGVCYRKNGESCFIEADSIILCGGVAARSAEAMELSAANVNFYIIGDCEKPANVHRALKAAYAAANRI